MAPNWNFELKNLDFLKVIWSEKERPIAKNEK
jgi:hypothetical protein